MTPRTKRLRIAGKPIERGGITDVDLEISTSYLGLPVHIPIRVIDSGKPGPRVLISGCLHGDELNGLGIVRQLLYGDPPKLVRGTLVCAPVVNVLGMENHSRYLPDRRDLNRCFPGSAEGSQSSRLAHLLFDGVVKQCDYVIDFHSAAVRRTNYPNVRADMKKSAVRSLARAFGCELIVDGKGPLGSLRRTACDNGIACIILEAGEVWKIESSVVEIGVRGCLNVLKWLDMIEGTQDRPLFQTTIKKTRWVRSDESGILGFGAQPGVLVEEGEVLATTYNIFGTEQATLTSPVDGIVLGMATMPAVKPGEPVYHIAEVTRSTFRRIQKRLEDRSARMGYHRVTRQLGTSVTGVEENGS